MSFFCLTANTRFDNFSKVVKSTAYCLLPIVYCLLSSCANMGSPSGGKKDTTPPKVLKENPANKSTHFNANNITVTFDEYVQLNDIANQLLISPAFNKTPEVKLKGKSIVLPIKEQLRENTTYTINFGNAIKDLNEGNTLEDYKFVFATGDYLDSLKISGKVFFANNKKTEKGILVMLYDKSDDSIPMKEKPVYYSKTNDAGEFKIENIKAGKYKLFALKDMNFNMLYDLPNEQIAFSDNNIVIDTFAKTYELAMFQEKKLEQKLLNAYSKNFGRVHFVFSQPTDSIQIINSDENRKYTELWEYSFTRDTITYWFSDVHEDSLTFFIKQNKKIIDTAVVKIPAIPKDSLIKENLIPVSQKNTGKIKNISSNHDLNRPFSIEWNHPIRKSDFKNIILLEDSQQVNNFFLAFEDSVKRKLKITYKWKDTTQYSISIPSNTFTDLFNLSNDSLLFSFKTKPIADYGNLEIKIKRNDTAIYFLELQNEQENVLEKIKITSEKESKINFKMLSPVKYLIKITKDENQNNKWDTGDYLQKKQPEKIFYYSQPISLRANWDMDIEMSIGE